MLTFIKILAILAIGYWVAAAITNKIHGEKVLPNHLSILLSGIVTAIVLDRKSVV